MEGSLRDKFRLGSMPTIGAIPSASEGGIVLFSPAYYAACAVGGVLSCGGTHTLVTPLDVVKCNMQTDPKKYTGIFQGFGTVLKEQGFASLVRGWVPTLFGYSAQGYGGLFKGLTPLWGRQIPYTMMKFACFENTVKALYRYVVPKPQAECSKTEQLGVSFLAGYIAGVFCAIVSHPADNMVSKLNASKGASVGQIVEEMGTVGLFTRGLPLRIVMIGTLTGLQWGIYDAFKVYVGLPTTGGGKK